MKKRLLFSFLFILSIAAKAQTISDAYFRIRNQYWSEEFKNSIKKNNLDEDAIYNDILKNGALREEKVLKHLFGEYLKKEGENLDTSNLIYFLTKKVQMNSEIVIWNLTDTIYAKTNLSIPNIKNPKKLKLYSFNNSQINLGRNYLTTVMNMVSKVKIEDIQNAIDEKTLDKNGKFRFTLDGSSFELYVFRRSQGEYEVKKFLFMNPKFN